MKKRMYIPGLLFVILITLFCLMVIRPNRSAILDGQHYIAHACGQIDGYNYTNCLEAFEKSVSYGIKYIEVDFCLTTDSVLVAAHDWKHYNKITLGVDTDRPLSFAEFKSRKIYGRYTPMTAYDVDSLLRVYPNVYFVTDKISDPVLLEKYFSKYKHRMCVECFSHDDYQTLYNLDYYLPMLSCTCSNLELWKQRIKKYFTEWNFVVPDFFVTNYKAYKGPTKYNFLLDPRCSEASSYAIYSCKDRHQADSIFRENSDVKLIYVDKVEPFHK